MHQEEWTCITHPVLIRDLWENTSVKTWGVLLIPTGLNFRTKNWEAQKEATIL